MKVIESSIIYENPLPQLRSRQAAFPFLFQRKDGVIGAVYCIGEAFESVDKISYVSLMADIFAFLKFGQPGAIVLDDGDVLVCHWFAEQGQYKAVATRVKL